MAEHVPLKATPRPTLPQEAKNSPVQQVAQQGASNKGTVEFAGEGPAKAAPVEFGGTQAFTSSQVLQASDNIITDRRANYIPPTAEQEEFMKTATAEDIANMVDWSKMDETNLLENVNVVAHNFQLPKHLDIKLKDPAWSPRWVQFKHSTATGNRFDECVAMGFIKAVPEDILGSLDYTKLVKQDGGIVCNDVVLMKIHKSKLLPILKGNLIKANRFANAKERAAAALKEARKSAAEGVGSNPHGRKLRFFMPEEGNSNEL